MSHKILDWVERANDYLRTYLDVEYTNLIVYNFMDEQANNIVILIIRW